MIQIKKKQDCCGCQACVQRCPKQCISLIEDNEGFLYPEVNPDKCINCGLCEKVCPCKRIESYNPQPDNVLALKHNDEAIRRNSSSGGAFTAIATEILKNGGVVFGARFDEKWKVVHSYTETIEGLNAFRGSKYVQSSIGTSFLEVEQFLKVDRKVLFTGTPCQIKALHLFLHRQYENLVTMDFVCHGVPSPGIFRGYIQVCLNDIARKGEKNTVSLSPSIPFVIPKRDVVIPECMEVNDIRFRDKKNGWKKFSFALSLAEASADGEKIQFSLSNDITKNLYLKGFVSNLYLRPSCFHCPAKGLTSRSDITVADFWGQEYSFPEFDNNTGVSAIIINTDKGKDIIERIKDCTFKTVPFGTFFKYNSALYHSVTINPSRRKFWHHINQSKNSFEVLIIKSQKYTIIERIFITARNMFIKSLLSTKNS